MMLALVTLTSGLMSSWFWFQASRVAAVPFRFGRVEPDAADGSQTGWTSGLLVASNEAARLNKVAALWTAATMALGVIDNLIATWPS